MVVLGEGDLRAEAKLLDMMEQYHGQLSVQVSYTEDLAHRIQAGCDIFLMPSRLRAVRPYADVRPAGMERLLWQRRWADSRIRSSRIRRRRPRDFTFQEPDSKLFYKAVKTAVRMWEDRYYWNAMVERAMNQAFTWDLSATHYMDMYNELGVDV